jgi:hypothetical protein
MRTQRSLEAATKENHEDAEGAEKNILGADLRR